MTFGELKKIFEEKMDIKHLADIARELEVTPQAVSNWKARNEVPYKYIKNLRKKIAASDRSNIDNKTDIIGIDYSEIGRAHV